MATAGNDVINGAGQHGLRGESCAFTGEPAAGRVMPNRFGIRATLSNRATNGTAAHSNAGGAGDSRVGLITEDLGGRPWRTPLDAERDLSVPAVV